jgi:hypothetical protein
MRARFELEAVSFGGRNESKTICKTHMREVQDNKEARQGFGYL